MKISTRFAKHRRDYIGGPQKQITLIGEELVKKNVDFNYIMNKKNKIQKKIEVINGIKIHNLGNSITSPTTTKIRKKILNIIYSFD